MSTDNPDIRNDGKKIVIIDDESSLVREQIKNHIKGILENSDDFDLPVIIESPDATPLGIFYDKNLEHSSKLLLKCKEAQILAFKNLNYIQPALEWIGPPPFNPFGKRPPRLRTRAFMRCIELQYRSDMKRATQFDAHSMVCVAHTRRFEAINALIFRKRVHPRIWEDFCREHPEARKTGVYFHKSPPHIFKGQSVPITLPPGMIFDGEIDEVMLLDKVASPEDVREMYDNSPVVLMPPPKSITLDMLKVPRMAPLVLIRDRTGMDIISRGLEPEIEAQLEDAMRTIAAGAGVEVDELMTIYDISEADELNKMIYNLGMSPEEIKSELDRRSQEGQDE